MPVIADPMESVRALEEIPRIAARLIGRIPGLEVTEERAEAMARLAPFHRHSLEEAGLGSYPLVTAEQVHGKEVHLISDPSDLHAKGADGLLTRVRGITLGIYVADCAPVWVVAKDSSAGALLHSGKKGTELGIVPEGIRMLCSVVHCSPEELLVVIGPCIRPPCYEVDFAAQIRRQAREEGVMEIRDAMTCTACEPSRYYSYRRERGFTGRMLATLTLLP
jgi:copper oxidase (laccase) domain-containing protein